MQGKMEIDSHIWSKQLQGLLDSSLSTIFTMLSHRSTQGMWALWKVNGKNYHFLHWTVHTSSISGKRKCVGGEQNQTESGMERSRWVVHLPCFLLDSREQAEERQIVLWLLLLKCTKIVPSQQEAIPHFPPSYRGFHTIISQSWPGATAKAVKLQKHFWFPTEKAWKPKEKTPQSSSSQSSWFPENFTLLNRALRSLLGHTHPWGGPECWRVSEWHRTKQIVATCGVLMGSLGEAPGILEVH